MDIKQFLTLVVSLILSYINIVWSMNDSLVPGVKEENQTYCYSNGIITLSRNCDNIFLIGDQPYARVKLPDMEVVNKPFEFHKAEEKIHLQQSVNFTHRSLCELKDNNEMEKIVYYKPRNCTKAELQLKNSEGHFSSGRLLFVLSMLLLVYTLFL
ncbi:hypothetical protein WMY93_030573 [Mugilogobius chulae]|uniref:Uncharacterized protein n=1 Tax=Mugilogobius chulae TaxID=88201 RepID=A0AAW0MI49_9GOBI